MVDVLLLIFSIAVIMKPTMDESTENYFRLKFISAHEKEKRNNEKPFIRECLFV